ncbi:MAG: ABC transporter substrate-binding protein, partial [Treponema sp.]|nr:ABC transporter substrate-binding protein [Treponema sp.]
MKKISVFLGILLFVFFTCLTYEELTLEELENFRAQGLEELLLKTVSKPWQGEEFVPGIAGGSWVSVMNEDPKSFNILIAEQDATTSAVVGNMLDWLLDYDVIKREWKPRIATPEVIVDEENNTMQVVYTFRDDLYWTYYNSPRRIKVTSDDIIFWYDEIEGDPEFQSSGYYGQFVIMPDGSEERVTISKIDDLTFAFNFPRIISEPFLMTNMNFGPRHLYEPAKLKGGVNEVRSIFSIAVNPRTIPSMGKWFLVEYSHGQRLVYKRNPDYWNKDINDVSIPYTDEMIVRIIPEENTQLLLFKNGSIESYRLRPEDISGLVNARVKNYTVFNAESALGAPFWTFNQNPVNTGKPSYEWFVLKEFRQAMSCLLNRERINSQVFRGLAEPKLDIFPGPNPFYNPEIKNQFLFDTERAIELLSFININRDSSGTMRDWENRPVEFDLTIRSESTMYQDTASIIVDELSKIG